MRDARRRAGAGRLQPRGHGAGRRARPGGAGRGAPHRDVRWEHLPAHRREPVPPDAGAVRLLLVPAARWLCRRTRGSSGAAQPAPGRAAPPADGRRPGGRPGRHADAEQRRDDRLRWSGRCTAAFARYFPRDRTVLINSDGGSDDGTRAIVRDLSMDEADTVMMRHSLRTMHRIIAPYHGVPGKGSALAADLRRRRPAAGARRRGARSRCHQRHARVDRRPWSRPCARRPATSWRPSTSRHPLDGPLVSQLVRPLVRAAYGWRDRRAAGRGIRLLGPVCRRLPRARRLGDRPRAVRNRPVADRAATPWPPAIAAARRSLGPRTVAPGASRPGISETFGQVVGSLFSCLETTGAVVAARERLAAAAGGRPCAAASPPSRRPSTASGCCSRSAPTCATCGRFSTRSSTPETESALRRDRTGRAGRAAVPGRPVGGHGLPVPGGTPRRA